MITFSFHRYTLKFAENKAANIWTKIKVFYPASWRCGGGELRSEKMHTNPQDRMRVYIFSQRKSTPKLPHPSQNLKIRYPGSPEKVRDIMPRECSKSYEHNSCVGLISYRCDVQILLETLYACSLAKGYDVLIALLEGRKQIVESW
jgi:hypothetical protein